MWAKFGNNDPVELVPDGRDDTPEDAKMRAKVALPEGETSTVTVFRVDDSYSLIEAFTALTSPSNGAVQAHTDAAPEWVMASDPELAKLLAANYGCEVRKPLKADRDEMEG